MPDQLGLFGAGARPVRSREHAAPRASSRALELEARHERFRVLAASLPAGLRMGTSSWSFPGWHGLVYSRRHSAAALSKDGLREYATHPLLRTVGMDRTFYAPVPGADLAHYAGQLPDGFPCCAKAPAAVTSATLRSSGRPLPNPEFLSVERFERDVLDPFARTFRRHAGPFVLQFSPSRHARSVDAQAFVERLDAFLDALPDDFQYAVELRDRWALTGTYRDTLARHGVGHVYNYWSAMPLPGEQARVIPPEQQPFVMARLLLRPGTWYEEQKQVFAPFNALVEPDERMRGDVVDLVRRAIHAARGVFLLVNNKAEGSSPLTIEALAERLVAEGDERGRTRARY